MWIQATETPSASTNSVRRRAQTRRHPTTRVVPVKASPTRIGPADHDLGRAGPARRGRARVPRPVEAALRRVEPGQVLGVAQQDRGPQQPVRARLVEPDAERRGAGCRGSRAHGRRSASRSRVSRVTSRVPAYGAVWRSSRTSARPLRHRTRRAPTASRSSSSAACVRASSSWCRTSALMPRAPHLQSYASAAPSRSTVTSYGWISAATPSNRIRRSRRTAAAPTRRASSSRGQLLDERAADLAADLLAAVGDLQRRGQDRLGADAVAGRSAAAPNRVGNIVRQVAGSVVSPFITARARTRCAGRGVGEQVGGAADERIGLDARVDDGPAVACRVLEPHGRSPSATRTTCGNVDSQSMARCGSSIRPISSIARSIGGVASGSSVLAAARRRRPRRAARATRRSGR